LQEVFLSSALSISGPHPKVNVLILGEGEEGVKVIERVKKPLLGR